jgi:hypothetical protein
VEAVEALDAKAARNINIKIIPGGKLGADLGAP